ncbi:VOC family protein [Microlunatus sp. GCM10028923]|uniref:VOC family protein n=1 Tax=Microlunatus sp. GCM10028923 TaxID=3273400 RepID=UPI00361A7603
MITVTEQNKVAEPAFVAQAFRFSDEPAAMARFLEALGLGVLISKGTGWYDLRGRSGSVALHASGDRSDSGAPGGQTGLVMVAPEARAAAEYLKGQGLETTVWDESFGVQATVKTPFGGGLSINEEQNDLYGYERHELGDPKPGPIDVVVVFFTNDLDGAARFFDRFGFRADEDGSEDHHHLRNGDRGVILLHRADTEEQEGSVGLSFETDEPLEAVADRLTAAGYAPSLLDAPRRIAVTDPDGQLVEVWPPEAS